MAEIEEIETVREWRRILFPRVLKASFWGFIMGGEILIWLKLSDVSVLFAEFLPVESTSVSYFLLMFVAFEVAIQLLAGTIFLYVLRISRSLISVLLLISLANGGLITVVFQSSQIIPLPEGMSLVFTVDFQAVLCAFVLLSLVSLLKNFLKTIQFLSDKAEEPMIPAEFP